MDARKATRGAVKNVLRGEIVEEMDDELNDEHWQAVAHTANRFGIQDELVDWILFGDDDEDSKQEFHTDENFLNVYMALSEAYDEEMAIIRAQAAEESEDESSLEITIYNAEDMDSMLAKRLVGFN